MFKFNNKDKNDANSVVLLSLLLILNIFYTFFYCFYCWLWSCNCRLGGLSKRNIDVKLVNKMLQRMSSKQLKIFIKLFEAPQKSMKIKISVTFYRGGSRDFEKGWRSMSTTMVGRQKTNLGFRWSKKAKITLETISFWQNISISFFQFSPFRYI